MPHYDNPSLSERVASGDLRFLRNINQSPWAESADEQYMANLVAYVGRASLVLDAPMAPDGTFGTMKDGTGVYMLGSVYEQIHAE